MTIMRSDKIISSKWRDLSSLPFSLVFPPILPPSQMVVLGFLRAVFESMIVCQSLLFNIPILSHPQFPPRFPDCHVTDLLKIVRLMRLFLPCLPQYLTYIMFHFFLLILTKISYSPSHIDHDTHKATPGCRSGLSNQQSTPAILGTSTTLFRGLFAVVMGIHYWHCIAWHSGGHFVFIRSADSFDIFDSLSAYLATALVI